MNRLVGANRKGAPKRLWFGAMKKNGPRVRLYKQILKVCLNASFSPIFEVAGVLQGIIGRFHQSYEVIICFRLMFQELFSHIDGRRCVWERHFTGLAHVRYKQATRMF